MPLDSFIVAHPKHDAPHARQAIGVHSSPRNVWARAPRSSWSHSNSDENRYTIATLSLSARRDRELRPQQQRARPGYAAWSAAARLADVESGAALTPQARFRAGSILELAVATAVLQLVEHGQLSLDARLPKLLPSELTRRLADADAITLRMLLDHTSGIAEFDDAAFDAELAADPRRVWGTDEWVGLALSHPPTNAPGAAFHYSNTEYVLLGQIAMISTNGDLAKLLGALADGQLFDDAAALGLTTDFVAAPVPEQAQSDYGLGLARFEIGDVVLLGHIGGTAGFQSFDFYQPSTGVVVSGYMSCNGDFAAFVMPVLDAVGRALAVPTP